MKTLDKHTLRTVLVWSAGTKLNRRRFRAKLRKAITLSKIDSEIRKDDIIARLKPYIEPLPNNLYARLKSAVVINNPLVLLAIVSAIIDVHDDKGGDDTIWSDLLAQLCQEHFKNVK